MTITELQKRVAELKGWEVATWDGAYGTTVYSVRKPGSILEPSFDSVEEAIDHAVRPLSLLDEVEQEGYVTEIRYRPEFGYQCIIEEPGPIKLDETVSRCCATREIAILTAYIAYRESTKSGE